MKGPSSATISALAAALLVSAPAFSQDAPPSVPDVELDSILAPQKEQEASEKASESPDAAANTQSTPAATAPSNEQNADGDSIEEIVVTGTKRSQRLQEVPQAITYVDAEQLDRQNIDNINQIEKASPSFSASSGLTMKIRGLGTNSFSRAAEGSVGMVIDGVALGSSSGLGSGGSPLFDTERVEVLIGPQGTLFGRNSSAGVVNLVTKAPDLSGFDTAFRWDMARHDASQTQAMVNVPLSNKLGFRIAANQTRPASVFYNTVDRSYGESKTTGGRARFLYEATENLRLQLLADYEETEASGGAPWSIYASTPGSAYTAALNACGVRPSSHNTDVCTAGARFSDGHNYGGSLQAEYTVADYTVTSISAIRTFTTSEIGGDGDNLPATIRFTDADNKTRSLSQELRVASPSHERIEYVAGLYLYDSTIDSDNTATLGGVPARTVGDTDLKSIAAFSQATVKLTDQFNVIIGGRLERSEIDSVARNGAGAITETGKLDDTDFSYRGGLQYTFSQDLMTYLTYARGYKGGTVNDIRGATTNTTLIVKPEIPKAWEAGVKSTLLDGRLAANLAVFHTKVEDFQAQIYEPTLFAFIAGNAPSIKSQGVELSLLGAVTERVTLSGGLTYIDAKYGPGFQASCNALQSPEGCDFTTGTFDANGRALASVPKWKGVISAEYMHPVSDNFEAFFSTDAVFTSKMHFTIQKDPVATIGDRTQLGARVGMRRADGRFGISLYGRNMLDQFTPTTRAADPIGSFLFADPGAHLQFVGPESVATYGVTLDYRF